MFKRFTNTSLSRRTFLRAAGVSLALPWLDAMRPAVARSAENKRPPRRMIAIQTNMGILPQFFFPQGAGKAYQSSPYLDLLSDFRADLTVFSGVSHPGVDGGHQAEKAFLTAAVHPGASGFKNSISLDQFAAERIGILTRFPSLTLAAGPENSRSLSYTRSGVIIPAEKSPARLYEQLFMQGNEQQLKDRVRELREGRSILDFVGASARRLQSSLGARDRQRIDQYFTSVRELEGRLVRAEEWEHRPKPAVRVPQPKDFVDKNELVGALRLMYDMMRLAIETDSTRLVTLFLNTASCTPLIEGVSHETHSLTHHGNRAEVLQELRRIETAEFEVLAELLGGLKTAEEEGQSLLDRTMVLYGTCMGSANAHSNTNLPMLLAGGGFRHGQHLVFDTQRNYPLPNLFVSMLQRLGIEADSFATSTGTMRGLEMNS